jgi:hypothetical protein
VQISKWNEKRFASRARRGEKISAKLENAPITDEKHSAKAKKSPKTTFFSKKIIK